MTELKYHVEGRHATWLELFFDLVFVAGIGVITHHLAHVHHGHLEAKQLALYPLEFVPVWWIWATHTLYSNRFDTDDRTHRLASLAIMFLMVTMSALLGAGLSAGSASFIGFYIVIRVILALMHLSAVGRLDGATGRARSMATIIGVGAAVSGLSLAFDAPVRQAVFLGGIGFEMVAAVVAGRGRGVVPVHLPHLVERVGLLSIILLGESVISMVAGLRGIEWTSATMTAASTGFLLIGAAWWIYFDSFHFLERAERLRQGFVVLYSHVFFLMGLGILASVIGHAISGELAGSEFRWLAVAGVGLYYLGKQIPYFVAFPPFRLNIAINSLVCVAITAASTLLPRAEQTLVGMTLGMLFYTYSNLRWTLTKDLTGYLAAEGGEHDTGHARPA